MTFIFFVSSLYSKIKLELLFYVIILSNLNKCNGVVFLLTVSMYFFCYFLMCYNFIDITYRENVAKFTTVNV